MKKKIEELGPGTVLEITPEPQPEEKVRVVVGPIMKEVGLDTDEVEPIPIIIDPSGRVMNLPVGTRIEMYYNTILCGPSKDGCGRKYVVVLGLINSKNPRLVYSFDWIDFLLGGRNIHRCFDELYALDSVQIVEEPAK